MNERDSDGFGELIGRYAQAPGQGPGEDGEEGTGPTPEQLREMHEEERAARERSAEDVIYETMRDNTFLSPGFAGVVSHRIFEALRKEGLL